MSRGFDIPREQLEAGWETEEDELNELWMCECGHSYAQHIKGPVPADYCRHCPCPTFRDPSTSTASTP